MEPCRVLVIEDDPEFRSLLTHLLTGEGHQVTVADSALGTAAQVRQLDPNVILLDLGLPYRSGASLLAELKADRRTAHVPVVIVSAFPESLTDERRALAADVLEKPIDAQFLLDAIARACADAARLAQPPGDGRVAGNPRSSSRARRSAPQRSDRPT